MSVVTTNPLFDYSCFANTAFSITFVGTFFRITFAAPINQSYFLNRELYNVCYSGLGSNYVDLGEFDWGILTVNYTLCTSPVAGSRDAWIDAVNALITAPIPSASSLATGSVNDFTVGWNSTTRQFTSLGQTQLQRMRVTQSINQAVPFPNQAAAAAILYNVVADDPVGMWNPATFTATIPQDGKWILNFGGWWTGAQANITYFRINGVQVNWTLRFGTDPGGATGTVTRFLTAGTTVQVYQWCGGAGDSTSNSPANLNFFEIMRVV